ncbi:acyltransferase Pun1-like [Lycium ferocissimum]|uniref:acyltransferase Pun1-like n=1 Tax=Lycium ferocissimum TaxID=112874 RepID=UPI0028157D37|nr:acyltransferase Pun1-like [Lycium ferocissimum]
MAAIPSQLVSIHEKTIVKPSSPSPSPLKYHKLSFVDQSLSHLYIPLVFFYTKQPQQVLELAQITNTLQSSLARTLASYYPYAGSMKDSATIECNDKGVDFYNVYISRPMSEILNRPYDHHTETCNVFPKNLPWKNSFDGSLLVAQLSHFGCGGIAVSTCLSHKIGDGSSAASFLRDWARATRDPNIIPRPEFVGDSIFPSRNSPLSDPVFLSNTKNCTHRKFLFSGSKLRALRTIVAAESGVKNPTRAEVVSAILFKFATKAASRIKNSVSFRPSMMLNDVDIRPLIVPPLPQNSIGNLLSGCLLIVTEEDEMKIPTLVHNLRKELESFYKKDPVRQNDLVMEIEGCTKNGRPLFDTEDFDMYLCSNMCKFSGYSIDFGWGKPERVSSPFGPWKNSFFLSADKSLNGVEAMVTLEEEHMLALEGNEEFIEFATPITSY